MLNVARHQTQFIPDPEPSNIPYLSTPFFTAHDVGFGGIEITDRYSATVCYPTENDCVTYRNELFGQDAHNIATGDFNGDGFEDLVVAWAIFPHTIDQSKKIYGPINIYLNDQNGGFAEDLNLYAASNAPKHPFAYRLVVDDLKSAKDGLKAGESLELVAEDLKNARSHLDEVVGVKFSDSLLGDIFESFCIGK